MAKIIILFLLIITGKGLFAQYVHYSDKRNINNSTPRAEAAPKAAPATQQVIVHDTVRIIVRDTVKIKLRDTVKTLVHDTIRTFKRDTIEIVVHDTINTCPTQVVYHKWPDKCPGLSGATPVLLNYIPKEIVLKLTEIYKGYLFSISSNKIAGNKVEYKLKVCEHGAIKFEYADANGNIIPSPK